MQSQKSLPSTLCATVITVSILFSIMKKLAKGSFWRAQRCSFTWLWRSGKASMSPGEERQRSRCRKQVSFSVNKCTFLSSLVPLGWISDPVKQIREIHLPVLHLEAEVHIKGRRMLGMEPWARDALRWDKEGHVVWLVEMRKIRLGSTPVPSRKGGKQKEKYPGSGVYLTSREDFKDFCVRAHTLEFIRQGWAERWKHPGTDRHILWSSADWKALGCSFPGLAWNLVWFC